jgi:hypothetical protein
MVVQASSARRRAVGIGLGPQGLADHIAAGAVRLLDGQERQQLACLAPLPARRR